MQLLQVIQEVKEIHARILRSSYFYGYSAEGRLAGGMIALVGAAVLSLIGSASPSVHFAGWGAVCALAVIANYFGLYSRVKSRDSLFSDPVLQPALCLVTGAVFTFALAAYANYQLLFGMWMVLFGFANIAARNSLPREATAVGYFYIAAGWLYLVAIPYQDFLNPWPMGLTFFLGESIGAYAFYRHNRSEEEV